MGLDLPESSHYIYITCTPVFTRLPEVGSLAATIFGNISALRTDSLKRVMDLICNSERLQKFRILPTMILDVYRTG